MPFLNINNSLDLELTYGFVLANCSCSISTTIWWLLFKKSNKLVIVIIKLRQSVARRNPKTALSLFL